VPVPRIRHRRRAVALTAAVVAVLVAGLAWLYVPLRGVRELSCEGRGLNRCRAVSGRVVQVQRHDEDGDGDVHLVLTSRDSLTLPGISVLKLSPYTQITTPVPHRLQWVSALGQQYSGSSAEHALDVVALSVR
jgi:hypothetical protein